MKFNPLRMFCALGVHRWEHLYQSSQHLAEWCSRCGIGRSFTVWGARYSLSKEAVTKWHEESADKKHRIRNKLNETT